MKFTEAFRRLGYELVSPRQDWSAEGDHGVCISLWRVEMERAKGQPYFDTREHADENSIWREKAGNRKRVQHLQRALDAFEGWVDLVVVHGTPDTGYKTADPWLPEKRRGVMWRVENLEEATGHFKVVQAVRQTGG